MKKIILYSLFLLTFTSISAQNITEGEYFWDTDPGEGNGIVLLAFDGNFNQALEVIFEDNATLPSIGNHVLGVRIKSTDGNWGAVYKRVFKIVSSLNIIENDFGTNIKLFPNPTTNLITIEFGDLKDTQVSITDILGRVIYKKNQGINQTLNISMNEFSQGIYFFNVMSLYSIKIIKVIKK